MSEFYLHIGLPRTATSNLQSHVFPKTSPDTLFLGKDPFIFPSVPEDFHLDEILESIEIFDIEKIRLELRYLLTSLMNEIKFQGVVDEFFESFVTEVFAKLRTKAKERGIEKFIFSFEALVNTNAARYCLTNTVEQYVPAVALSKAIRSAGFQTFKVICVYRDPIRHLASIYARNMRMRVNRKLATLTPAQFVEIQAKNFSVSPHNSILFDVMHKSHSQFTATLGDHHIMGFSELLMSKDVFRSLGIPGQPCCQLSAEKTNASKVNLPGRSLEDELERALEKAGLLSVLKAETLFS